MQLDGILMTQIVVLHMACLYIGLLVVRAAPISLRSFQAVYLLLGAANIAIHYVYAPEVDYLYLIIALAAGIAVTLLSTGLFGKRGSSVHYETALVAIGLFPWHLGWTSSLIYIGAAVILGLILQFASMFNGFHSMNRKMTTFSKAREKLSETDYTTLRDKISPIFTTPIGIAAVIAALYLAV